MKLKQGKVEVGADIPGAGDGYEGQVQVRSVNGEPTLFARLNGKWIQSPLLSGGSFYIPKAFTAEIILPDTNGDAFFTIPSFIALTDIISISVVVRLPAGSSIVYYTQLPVSTNVPAAPDANAWFAIKSSTRQLLASKIGLSFYGLKGNLTILYK